MGKLSLRAAQEEVAPEVEIVNSEQRIEVEAGKNKALKHILKIKDRKFQTKRFVSPSVSEQNKR